MVSRNLVNISSCNGLVPGGTKPLHEPMLTNPQSVPMTITQGQSYKRYISHQLLKLCRNLSKTSFKFYRGKSINLFPCYLLFRFDVRMWGNQFNLQPWICDRNKEGGVWTCHRPTLPILLVSIPVTSHERHDETRITITRQFIQQLVQPPLKMIKGPHLCVESTGDQWIPPHKGPVMRKEFP